MAAWLCTVCSTVFSVGAPCCPHCGSTKHVEEGQEMPKITRHEGPSIAGASIVGGSWSSEGDPDVWPAPAGEEGGEESSPGNSSETSPETPSSEPEPSEKPSPSRARTTGSRSKKAQTGSRSARSTGGGRAADTSAADEA
ncbi:hypothetical protein GCM10010251_92810 [Streptomyces aurantiogriseus]|uniref:Uncharacterized protein n=2 Tax=Streptomyces aurantiogriseus TaxID=66870 RepID=A0A918L078_9ACTN|nr:hypothetical protein GCM10010251_92810 [Streptomyces aurantiogriseus]